MMGALSQIVQDRNFEGMIKKQGETFEGMLGSLKDGWDSIIADFGSAFLPIAKEAMKIVSYFFDIIKNNIEYLKTTALVVGGVGAAIGIATLATKAWTIALAINPVIAGIVAVLALVTFAIAKFSDATEDASKKALENTEAELQNLNAKKKNLQATQKEAENNEKLLNEYDKLASKKNNTAKETERLHDISKKLSGKYSDLIIDTNNFKGSLEGVRTKAGEVKGEIAKYKDEILNLNKSITETEKLVAKLNFDKAIEDFKNAKVKEEVAWYQAFANYFTGDNDAVKKAKHYIDEYVKAIENAKSSGDFEKAFNKMKDKMTNDYGVLENKDIEAKARKKSLAEYNFYNEKAIEEYKEKLQEENDERRQVFNEHLNLLLNAHKLALKNFGVELAEAEADANSTVVEDDKKGKAKTEANRLADEMRLMQKNFELKKTELDKQKREEEINREEYNNAILEAEKKLQEGLIKIRNGAETITKKGAGVTDETKQEFEKAVDLFKNSIEQEQAIQKNKLARDKEYWDSIIEIHKKGEDTIQMYRDLGITNNNEYLKSLEEQLSKMSESALIELEKRYKAGEKLNEEELNALKSYMQIKEELFNKISDINVKTTNINMAGLMRSLEIKKGEFENGKLVLEDYTKFVTDNFDNLLKELNKPEYSNIFEKFQDNTLTQNWLDEEIKMLKERGDEYADSLNPIIEALEKFREEKKEIESKITADQQLFGDTAVTMLNAMSKGFGEAISSGFGKEGFKKLQESMFEGFKSILVQMLEFIEKQYILMGAKSLVDAIMNPVKGAMDAGLLVGAEVAIQTAKAAINSWTPKFATGGGVTGPTYLLAGENNKKEYIIPADVMKSEVRSILQKEFYKYTPNNYKQTVEVKLQPIEMVQKGRDLHGVIRQQEILEKRRTL